ncbi:MAG: hypothetical protein QGG53_30705, partial [Planctomycetota bacterium]|nr:hypothetical protein [Planctomycetota bacterium]
MNRGPLNRGQVGAVQQITQKLNVVLSLLWLPAKEPERCDAQVDGSIRLQCVFAGGIEEGFQGIVT